ncbi:MAG: MarR family transcriptional regulator [Saprospiraceae bacterium]|nr:MarR family transcriptional regulator [Saprospiraceae bacterium]
MKIEDEIKTTKQLSRRQSAVLNIIFTASWLENIITRRLKPFGITHQQYNVLRILNGSAPKGLTVVDIKSRMLDRESNVSRLVDKLHDRQLIRRIVDDYDRRKVQVSITESGMAMVQEIARLNLVDDSTMPGVHLDDHEVDTLASLLEKLRETGVGELT